MSISTQETLKYAEPICAFSPCETLHLTTLWCADARSCTNMEDMHLGSQAYSLLYPPMSCVKVECLSVNHANIFNIFVVFAVAEWLDNFSCCCCFVMCTHEFVRVANTVISWRKKKIDLHCGLFTMFIGCWSQCQGVWIPVRKIQRWTDCWRCHHRESLLLDPGKPTMFLKKFFFTKVSVPVYCRMFSSVFTSAFHGWDFSGYSQISGIDYIPESNKNGFEMHSECEF